MLLGDGAGNFAEGPGSPFDFGGNTSKLLLVDVNRDGQLDAVGAAGAGVRIMLGDGRGNFKPSPGSPLLTGRGVWRFAVADMNGDGKSDIITSNQETECQYILGQ